MALMFDIAVNNTADSYKYRLRFLFMNFALLDAVAYQKKCTPSDRANILSWIQNMLHHHLVYSMDTIPDMLENLKHGTWNEIWWHF